MSVNCTTLIVYNSNYLMIPERLRTRDQKANKVTAVTTTTNAIARDKMSLLPKSIQTHIFLFLSIRDITRSARISPFFKMTFLFTRQMLVQQHKISDPNAVYLEVNTRLLTVLEKSISSEYQQEFGRTAFDNKRVVEDIPRTRCPFQQRDALSRFLITHATAVHHDQEFEASERLWQPEYIMPKILQLALNDSLAVAQFIVDTLRPVWATHPHVLDKVRELSNVESINID